MLGLGVGSILMPPIAQRLIALYGWRSAYGILGVVVLVLAIPPVGLFLKTLRRSWAYRPTESGVCLRTLLSACLERELLEVTRAAAARSG
jgi:hypothetical protein